MAKLKITILTILVVTSFIVAEGISDTTQAPVDTTTLASEDISTTTTEINEAPSEATTEPVNCVCDCVDGNGEQTQLECTSKSPVDETTTESASDNETTTEAASDNENEDTTTVENTSEVPEEETTTTVQSEEEEATTIQSEESSSTSTDGPTTTSTSESTTSVPETTSSPPPLCDTPALEADPNNCAKYFDCSSEGSIDGSFRRLSKSCAENEAFNPNWKRCGREISSCASNPIDCLMKGSFADPSGNTSYYICEPRYPSGFYLFHVNCPDNQIFYPVVGKCLMDFNNLPLGPVTGPYFPPFNWNQIRDIDIVKAEMKLLKQQDKLKEKLEKEKLKQEENRQKEIMKLEENRQKEIAKEAKRRAKEEEKFKKAQAKLEGATVQCLNEGYIPSQVDSGIYYACIKKKNEFKAMQMKCPIGLAFNQETTLCEQANSKITSIGNATDSDDDDEDD